MHQFFRFSKAHVYFNSCQYHFLLKLQDFWQAQMRLCSRIVTLGINGHWNFFGCIISDTYTQVPHVTELLDALTLHTKHSVLPLLPCKPRWNLRGLRTPKKLGPEQQLGFNYLVGCVNFIIEYMATRNSQKMLHFSRSKGFLCWDCVDSQVPFWRTNNVARAKRARCHLQRQPVFQLAGIMGGHSPGSLGWNLHGATCSPPASSPQFAPRHQLMHHFVIYMNCKASEFLSRKCCILGCPGSLPF